MAGFRYMDIMWIFFLTVMCSCVYSIPDHDEHVCKISMENCATDDCTAEREKPCYHGDCTEKGSCTCHPFWAGEYCNETVVEENEWNTVVKSRQLRAAPDVTGLTAVGGADLDCSLALAAADAAITTVTPGDKFTLIFEVTIPSGFYADDVIIEIFTDDINGTFAMLCDPTLGVGVNLDVDPDRITPVMESNTGYLISHDTATYDLGIVKNGGGVDDVLQVSFPVAIIDNPTIQDGDTYWLSTGIEYSGGTRLWIGQLGFVVQRVLETIPATVISLGGPTTPAVDQPHKFSLDITSYQRLSSMSVSVSTADVTQNNICRMEVCSFGDGYCVDYTKTAASYTYVNATGHYEAASVNLDVLSYSGLLSDTVNSLITLDVIVDIPSSTLGVAQTLNAEVTENGGSITDTFSYTPIAAIAAIEPANAVLTVATPTASCTGDPCQLAYSESVQYEVTITVPPDSTFAPVDVKFISDDLADGTPAVGSCGTPVVFFNQIDDDIAGGKAWANKADTMVEDIAGDTVIHLYGVMNMGSESAATIKLGTNLFFSANAVTGTNYNLNVEIHAGGTLQNTVALPAVTLSATPNDLPPLAQDDPNPAVMLFDASYPVGSYDIPPGGFAVLKLTITPEPSAQCSYVLSVGANSTSLRLLEYKVTFVGSAFTCGNTDAWLSAKGDITAGNENTQYDTSEIDLGVVTSSRWSADTVATVEDTIEVEATVQLSDDRSIVADGSEFPVAMSVLFGSNRLWVGDGSIRADYSTAYPLAIPSVNDLTFAEPVVDVVTRGGQSKLHHTITLPETTSFTYSINYTTQYSWMQITNVQLTSVGGYLPGLLLHPPTVTFGGNSDGNYAEVAFGSVSNVLRQTPTAEDAVNMTFVMEVTVDFANTTDVDRGSWGIVSANMVVGNGDTTQEVVNQVTYQADLPATTFTLNCPASSLLMKPGESEACDLTINMVDAELPLHLEIETMMNLTATINLVGATVTTVGRNVVGDFAVGTAFTLNSSDSTTQNNKMILDGNAQNTFTFTADAGTFVAGDDDIVISVTIQMTDAFVNDPGSIQRMEIGASAGDFMIWVAYHDFTVERDGTEVPALTVAYTYTQSSPNLNPGDSIFYDVTISHDLPTSTAEPINMKIRLMLPLYVNFTQFVDQNTDSRYPVPTYDVSMGGVILTVGRLFFSDSIHFKMDAFIDTNYKFYDKTTWQGTTPLQVAYQITHRTGSATPDGEYLSADMQYVTYSFTVVPSQDESSTPECTSPVALGMQNGGIQDCQITGSSQPEPTAMPHHARLNAASAWQTEARGGPFLYSRFLKVDLGQTVTLTSLETQGGAIGDIGSFDLLYSTNDALYKEAVATDEFNHRKSNPPANTILSNDVVPHTLASPVEARYLVIKLTDYDFNSVNRLHNMMRVEFYGCATGTPDPDPCPPADTNLHEYDRGFTVAGDTLYVCDSKTHLQSGLVRELSDGVYAYNWRRPKMQCYVTQDGSTWDAMPERIHNVVGYLPSLNNTIYAIFEDSPGYAMGMNYGETWNMISIADYQTFAADAEFISHESVGFNPALDIGTITVGNYEASFNGMTRFDGTNWVSILDWNGCCTPECKLNGINSC